MSKTIGIVGTRSRDSINDYTLIEEEFVNHYVEGDIVCSGLCPQGGDRFAVVISQKYNTEVLWYPAEWNKYGRAAGFIRNGDIAKASDVLIACVSKSRKGGTEDTIMKFLQDKGNNNNLYII